MDQRSRGHSRPIEADNPVGDLELARAVAAGSRVAWHDFIDRYSGLIFTVIRRQLFREDEDDVRGLYVNVLESLYRGGLGKYGGRSTLATWLIVYTRNRANDLLRRRFGREREPRWWTDLTTVQQLVLRFFYGESLPLDVVVQQLAWLGHDLTVDQVIQVSRELKERVPDPFWAQRAATGPGGGRATAKNPALVRSLAQLRWELEAVAAESDPQSRLIAGENEQRTDRLRQALDLLPQPDQDVLRLRFHRQRTAPQIARELNLGRPRKVYTIIERGLTRLRDVLAKREGAS